MKRSDTMKKVLERMQVEKDVRVRREGGREGRRDGGRVVGNWEND